MGIKFQFVGWRGYFRNYEKTRRKNELDNERERLQESCQNSKKSNWNYLVIIRTPWIEEIKKYSSSK